MADSQPYSLRPGEGRFIDLGDFGVTVKASENETAGVVSVLENAEPPGFGPPIHVHHDCAEAFYVLEGEYVMYLEDGEYVCPAGSFIFIPQGARHGFRVGNAPSRKLNFYVPRRWSGISRTSARRFGGRASVTTSLRALRKPTTWRSSARRPSDTCSRRSRAYRQGAPSVSSMRGHSIPKPIVASASMIAF